MITHVPQTIFLKDSTIRDNIIFDFKNEDINNEKIKKSATLACIDEFINTLEAGYDTHIGENGSLLSGGQRQRIGIARALYRENKILIFDEATSALDNETEDKVIKLLLNLDKSYTVILVSHKLSEKHTFDKILKVEKGDVKEL